MELYKCAQRGRLGGLIHNTRGRPSPSEDFTLKAVGGLYFLPYLSCGGIGLRKMET